ncbi:hypothetical protein BC829DRAFT_163070 [Chytridium lagenaria]|nr:hypothetical protein BC829DRAFT_163070 [Chytridium lagenaria]
MLYNKLILTIDDYDHVTLADGNARAKDMLDSYRQSIEAVERLTRQRVVAEYQKRISHDECDAQISSLSRECAIMKEETTRIVALNNKLTQEVEEFKVYKSNAEAEMKILLSDCAKRRIHCSALKKRLQVATQKLEETEKVVVSLEADLTAQTALNPNYSITPRSSMSKRPSLDVRAFHGKRRSTLQNLRLSKFGEEREDLESIHYSSEDDRHSTMSSRKSPWPFRDAESVKSGRTSSGFNTSDDNISEDDINDEEWETCKEHDFRRPTWNASVKTTLLSKKSPIKRRSYR